MSNKNNIKVENGVRDPYNNRGTYLTGKAYHLERLSGPNKALISQYLLDMETGINVNGKRGKRGYARLKTLLCRLVRICSLLDRPLPKLTARELHDLFNKMETGQILKDNGERYKSTNDYIKVFKAFWHWYMRVMRKEGKDIEDICIDLSGASNHKPEFVYFTLESLRKMLDQAKFDYKVLMLFMFDSGVRVTEMLNIQRRDIIDRGNEKFYLQIREETSKTFGRKIKLMLCCGLLKDYLNQQQLQPNDFVFQGSPSVINQYIKRLSEKVYGKNLINLKENRATNKKLTLYDFRHSSSCYWLPRYKSESALKYRFGWKKSSMIFYYSELLGMRDSIEEEDILIDTTKTELQQELDKVKSNNELMQERLKALESEFDRIKGIEKELTTFLKLPEIQDKFKDFLNNT